MATAKKIDFFSGIETELQARAKSAEAEIIKRITKHADEQIEQIQGLLTTGAKLEITSGRGTHTIEGLKHKQLPDLIKLATLRLPVLMVGMAGTGKTHAAEQVAEALGLPFYAMSVGAQTSKSDIMGFIHAGGKYVPTLFKKAYESGGVFLMDELDAGNANVLIQVNAALSNNYCAFPEGMVKRHPNFIFIATANTWGNGANRQYVGRNQLDAATLDRFSLLDWHIDTKLEGAIVGESEAGKAWHTAIQAVRKFVEQQGLRVLITPRATIRGAKLLEAGFKFKEVCEIAVINGANTDLQDTLRLQLANNYVEPKKSE